MKKIALLLPVIAGTLYGMAGVFIRTLYAAGFSNTTVIFARNAPGALILLAIIALRDRSSLKISKKQAGWLVLCALLGMLVTNMGFNMAATSLSLSFAAVLLSIAPVYTLIISRIAFGHKITPLKIVCVIMTITGCVLVSGIIGSGAGAAGANAAGSWAGRTGAGLIAGVIAGFTYGLYSIFSKKAAGEGAGGLIITFFCFSLVALVVSPFADYGTIGAFIMQDPPKHILFLLAHSLCVAVIPYFLLTVSLSYISPGTAMILASCEPVAAMIFGVLFFHEIPTIYSVAGLVITVTALIILCRE